MIFTADIVIAEDARITTFADDTAIIVSDVESKAAAKSLHDYLMTQIYLCNFHVKQGYFSSGLP